MPIEAYKTLVHDRIVALAAMAKPHDSKDP
jgi:hypothetical protein